MVVPMASCGFGGDVGRRERMWLLMDRSSGCAYYKSINEVYFSIHGLRTICGFASRVATVLRRIGLASGRAVLEMILVNMID